MEDKNESSEEIIKKQGGGGKKPKGLQIVYIPGRSTKDEEVK